jgi:hypothetical protein
MGSDVWDEGTMVRVRADLEVTPNLHSREREGKAAQPAGK